MVCCDSRDSLLDSTSVPFSVDHMNCVFGNDIEAEMSGVILCK